MANDIFTHSLNKDDKMFISAKDEINNRHLLTRLHYIWFINTECI